MNQTQASALEASIRDDIRRCALLPGQKLNLRAMSERYGAGQNPIREALSRLVATGLVISQDQRGFRVADISVDEARDIQRLRMHLDCWALRESIERGDAQWEARVIGSHHLLHRVPLMSADGSGGVNPEWDQHHREFHRVLISGISSPWLEHFHLLAADQAARYRNYSVFAPAPESAARDIQSEHAAIVGAVVARDADRACTLLQQHYQRTIDALAPQAAERPADHKIAAARIAGRLPDHLPFKLNGTQTGD